MQETTGKDYDKISYNNTHRSPVISKHVLQMVKHGMIYEDTELAGKVIYMYHDSNVYRYCLNGIVQLPYYVDDNNYDNYHYLELDKDSKSNLISNVNVPAIRFTYMKLIDLIKNCKEVQEYKWQYYDKSSKVDKQTSWFICEEHSKLAVIRKVANIK